MKGLNLFCCLAYASAAFGTVLPSPSVSDEVDAEASANVALGVETRKISELRIRVSLESTPTNAVSVAIGCDADGDGTLAPSEEDVSFGCDCGAWFVRDAEGFVEDLGSAAFGRVERELVIPMRGNAADWDLVRVVRHGSASDENISIDATRRHLYLRIR